MALINCPECSKQISDKAVACPHCGLPGSYFSAENNASDESVFEAESCVEQNQNEGNETGTSTEPDRALKILLLLKPMMIHLNLTSSETRQLSKLLVKLLPNMDPAQAYFLLAGIILTDIQCLTPGVFLSCPKPN